MYRVCICFKNSIVFKDLDLAKKGKPLQKTKSFFIAAQNNAISTNYVTAKIDKTLQNSKYRLCGD